MFQFEKNTNRCLQIKSNVGNSWLVTESKEKVEEIIEMLSINNYQNIRVS